MYPVGQRKYLKKWFKVSLVPKKSEGEEKKTKKKTHEKTGASLMWMNGKVASWENDWNETIGLCFYCTNVDVLIIIEFTLLFIYISIDLLNWDLLLTSNYSQFSNKHFNFYNRPKKRNVNR